MDSTAIDVKYVAMRTVQMQPDEYQRACEKAAAAIVELMRESSEARRFGIVFEIDPAPATESWGKQIWLSAPQLGVEKFLLTQGGFGMWPSVFETEGDFIPWWFQFQLAQQRVMAGLGRALAEAQLAGTPA